MTVALALGWLALATALPQAASSPMPMDAPTEAEMRAALVDAADWTMTVTGADGQIAPPPGSPSWEVESAGRMCLNGMVLLRAYQVTGDTDYLDRAKACAALANSTVQAGKAYVVDRTGVPPGEAAGGFVNVQRGKVDDAFQAGYTGRITYNLWECTRGMLFLIEMYHETGDPSYAADAVTIDRLIHRRFASGDDPANGLFFNVRLSSAGEWTNSTVDSTVEHAVLLWTLCAAGEDLPLLWEDRSGLLDYIASVAKGDGSYDDRTTYAGQTDTSETQHAVMIAALRELGESARADDLASWVLGQQAANGSFECPHDMDDYGDTSWATLGLLPYGEVDAGARAIGWLMDEQKADGSWPYLPDHPPWGSTLYSTEWAALAVYEGLRNLNLQINDTMLRADPIQEGEPPRVVGFTVNATVNNQGLATARAATVRAYDGEPSLGKLMDEVMVDVPALGSACVALEVRPEVPGPHEVYVRISCEAGHEFCTSDNLARIHDHINRDPTGVITSPHEGEQFAFQAVIGFSVGSVVDLDEDVVGYKWTDNATGVMSTEPAFERVLPPGDHHVTLRLMDGNGPGTYLEVNLSVRHNLAPEVRITTPSDGSRYLAYETVDFDASETSDPEGHELTFSWMSNVSDLIGKGATLSSQLPPGEHVITVSVSDGWVIASKSVTITVVPTHPPEVVISAPAPDSQHVATSSVRFGSEGTMDPDSDPLAYQWTSNIDGLLSVQPSFLANLSVGQHTITLAVTDGHYDVTEQVAVSVIENRPPTAVISSPEDGARFASDQVVELNGSLSGDPEDAVTYLWVSDIEGILGDTPFVVVRLSRGEHRITLWVDDGYGHNMSAQVTVIVLNLPPSARISAPAGGATLTRGEEAEFTSTGSSDPEGDTLTFAWEFRAAGGAFVPFSEEATARYTFDKRGDYEVWLTVSDGVANNTTVVTFEVVREDKPEESTPGFTALAAACATTTALALASRRRRLP